MKNSNEFLKKFRRCRASLEVYFYENGPLLDVVVLSHIKNLNFKETRLLNLKADCDVVVVDFQTTNLNSTITQFKTNMFNNKTVECVDLIELLTPESLLEGGESC